MIEEIPKDVSLLRCTLKKSEQVFSKVVLLVSYAIVVLALLGCGYLLFTGVLIPSIVVIPWYYYLAGIAILAIPVYSFLWCIARELTDEDWDSKEAKALAAAVFAAAVFAAAVFAAAVFAAAIVAVAAAVVGAAVAAVVIATFAVAAATTPAVAAVAVAVAVVDAAFVAFVASDSKPMRFPGACLHYWRRMRK